MIEEMSMAVAMSVAFAIPTYYFCELQGSFFVVWLVWLASLAVGIGKSDKLSNLDIISRPLPTSCPDGLVQWMYYVLCVYLHCIRTMPLLYLERQAISMSQWVSELLQTCSWLNICLCTTAAKNHWCSLASYSYFRVSSHAFKACPEALNSTPSCCRPTDSYTVLQYMQMTVIILQPLPTRQQPYLLPWTSQIVPYWRCPQSHCTAADTCSAGMQSPDMHSGGPTSLLHLLSVIHICHWRVKDYRLAFDVHWKPWVSYIFRPCYTMDGCSRETPMKSSKSNLQLHYGREKQ